MIIIGRCLNLGRLRIERKAGVDFFKNNPLFEYRQFQDPCGH
jgi:hypothetical protein